MKSVNIPTHLVQAIKNIVSAYDAVSSVWVFGSRARGDHEARSDIDLAVKSMNLDDRNWTILQEKIEEIETLLMIDLIRFDTAPTELKNNIQKEGVKIYERS